MRIIYKIINLLDDTVIYIGQTDYLVGRKSTTRWQVNNGYTYPIHNKIREIGWNNIKYQIHTQVESQTEADAIESKLIESISTVVNSRSGGLSGDTLSEDHKKKLIKNHKGTKGIKGKLHTDETKQKISIANTGKIHSDETKQKISQARKNNKNIRKLTDDQIKSIKADTRFQKDIATDHGITQQHVSLIKCGKWHSEIN